MPIQITRPNWQEQLDRMSYPRGVELRRETRDFLVRTPYAFTADTLAARLNTPASAAMIEHVLTTHPDEFEHAIKDNKIYWYVESE